MPNKYVRVTMPDGTKWDVPAWLIAQNRAAFYHSQGEDSQEIYIETMDDPEELREWAAGNMDWEDVREHARIWRTADPVSYNEGWVNGDKEIVEY